MGNLPSRLCSPDTLDDAPPPSCPPSLPAFQSRPLVLSAEPPRLRNIPSTSSFGLSTSDAGTAACRSLRTRASSATLGRTSSHKQRSRLLSLSLARSPSASQRRLSPNSEQLLAIEFGIAPGQTKVVSLRTPKLDGSQTRSPGPPTSHVREGEQNTVWVLEGQIPSPHLHLGASEHGSMGNKGFGKRWSLRSLAKSDQVPVEAETKPMLEHESPHRPAIPPRSASLPGEVKSSVPEAKAQDG
jgi:hypothetical protein